MKLLKMTRLGDKSRKASSNKAARLKVGDEMRLASSGEMCVIVAKLQKGWYTVQTADGWNWSVPRSSLKPSRKTS